MYHSGFAVGLWRGGRAILPVGGAAWSDREHLAGIQKTQYRPCLTYREKLVILLQMPID